MFDSEQCLFGCEAGAVYKPVDLANEYGDKGTISKVLNYKQALSLTMIRRFSKLLHIPANALIAEYKLNK